MKHLTNLILLFLTSFSVYGHSPYELVYDIYQHEKVWELKIHLTPVAAIEILESYYPSLIEEETVNLKTNAVEVVEYFKDHILIAFGTGENTGLKLKSYNLLQHDSEIVFELIGVPSIQDFWKIKVTALLDVYNRAKNIVKIQLADGVHQAVLNQEIVHVIFNLNDNRSIVKASVGWVIDKKGIGVSFLLFSELIFLFLLYKKVLLASRKK
jgi:hypothetical protein